MAQLKGGPLSEELVFRLEDYDIILYACRSVVVRSLLDLRDRRLVCVLRSTRLFHDTVP